MEGSGKGAGTFSIARRERCGVRKQRVGGTGAGRSGEGGGAKGRTGGQGGVENRGEKREQGRDPGKQYQAAIVGGGGGGRQTKAEPTPHRQVCGAKPRH